MRIPLTSRIDPPAILLEVTGAIELDTAEQLARDLDLAVRLVRGHLGRVRGGQATKGLSTPAKRRASRANGRKGGRPKGSDR